MSFRSTTNARGANVNSLTINAPAGLVAGDVMLALIGYGAGANTTITPPSGWSQVGSTVQGDTYAQTALFTKVAGSSEPSSYTWTLGSTGYGMTGFILDYYNVTGIDVSATANTGGSAATSEAAASVTTTGPNETVVAFWVEGASSSGISLSLPGGLTSRATLAMDQSTGYYEPALVAGDYTGPSTPGSTSPGSASSTQSSFWATFTVALTTAVPLAPTLNTPANGAYTDLQNTGGPFAWTYNTGGATGGQTGYHLREKTTGSYSYWNAGTGAFQGTEVANTSTATSITFAAGKWTDGNTYNWSVASVDANGTGPYASDFTVNAQAVPSVSVTAPTGSVTASQTPTTGWGGSKGK